MKLRVIGLALCMSLAGVTAFGDEADISKQGKVLAYTCHGCHGIENYKNTYPTYSVPKLGGQHSQYIVDALKEYASGDRAHSTMHAHAATLSEADRTAIAVYFQGPAPRAASAPTGSPPTATAVCVTCHGNDGLGIANNYPIIAGQHRDYLEQALHDYKSGKRKNAIMAGIVGQLQDEDIRVVSEFFAKQKSPLCSTDQIRKQGKCD